MPFDYTLYPFSTAASLATGSIPPTVDTLLASILLMDLAEISNADDGAVERYIRSTYRNKKLQETGTHTDRSIMFWVYPTTLHGPFQHIEEEGKVVEVRKHGVLVTLEEGADIKAAQERILAAVPQEGITHVHIVGDSAQNRLAL